MPPKPLILPPNSGSYTSSYDYQSLTPRTPHSRAGRAEEARHELDAEDAYGLDDGGHLQYEQQQAEPLLTSSASASFPPTGHRNRANNANGRHEGKTRAIRRNVERFLSSLPLVMGITIALFLLLMVAVSLKRPDALLNAIGVTNVTEDNEIVESTTVPSPAHDDHTLSYANYTKFPLTPMEYAKECQKIRLSTEHRGGYWYMPPGGPIDVAHHDKLPTTHLPESGYKKVCTSTITYMLDGYVGLTADLALIAQAAGLAREQNRTFLIDDRYWNRGKWTDHFQDIRQRQPGPEPGCLAPPPEELVACPRVARHWVISSRTAIFHFGNAFSDEFEDPYARSLKRLQPIYERAEQSLSQTIRPNAENARLIRAARTELATALSPADTRTSTSSDTDIGTYLGVHIRRGDRKAESFPHRGSYVPVEEYSLSVLDTWSRLISSPHSYYVIWLASDSPSAIVDFDALLPESARLLSLSRSENPELQEIASKQEYVQREFNLLSAEERVSATRGALVDFALVSGLWVWGNDIQPLATVCTLSSNICKLAAVGFGWDRAFGFGYGDRQGQMEIDNAHKRWVDIDSKGIIEPVWRAYQMF